MSVYLSIEEYEFLKSEGWEFMLYHSFGKLDCLCADYHTEFTEITKAVGAFMYRIYNRRDELHIDMDCHTTNLRQHDIYSGNCGSLEDLKKIIELVVIERLESDWDFQDILVGGKEEYDYAAKITQVVDKLNRILSMDPKQIINEKNRYTA